MADEIDKLDIDPEDSANDEAEEAEAEEVGGDDDAQPEADEESNEPVLELEGVEPPSTENGDKAPGWLKDLRKRERQLARENAELRSLVHKDVAPVKVPPKPTLEDCDYDPDRFEQSLLDWSEAKRKAAEQEQKQAEAAQKAQAEWNGRLSFYVEAKKKLGVRDYDEKEQEVRDALSEIQQGIIISGADNPANVVYLLGKYPQELARISAITDPVKFSFAVAKLEGKIKQMPGKKSAPAPERKLSGSGGTSSKASNDRLEQLRSEAARTGDMSKVMAYKKQMAKKA